MAARQIHKNRPREGTSSNTMRLNNSLPGDCGHQAAGRDLCHPPPICMESPEQTSPPEETGIICYEVMAPGILQGLRLRKVQGCGHCPHATPTLGQPEFTQLRIPLETPGAAEEAPRPHLLGTSFTSVGPEGSLPTAVGPLPSKAAIPPSRLRGFLPALGEERKSAHTPVPHG